MMMCPTRLLGDLCKLVNGKAYKAHDWAESGLPIIRIQNLNDSTKPFNYWAGGLDRQVHVQEGDMLFAWSGTPGTSFGVHIWDGPEGVLNQHIFRVDVTSPEISKEWLKFCIDAQLVQLIGQAHGGVGLKHVTKGTVESIQIPLPSQAERSRIITAVNDIDRSIFTTKQLIRKLEMIREGLINDLLKYGIDENGTLRSPETHDFVDSRIGLIPESWNCRQLIEYFELHRGYDITVAEQTPGAVPVVSSGGISSFHSESMCSGPGVVTGRKGTIGKVFYIEDDYWPHDTTLYVSDFKGNDPYFVRIFLEFLDLTRFERSTANPTLNRNDVHPTWATFPPHDEQLVIVEIIQSIEHRISSEVDLVNKYKKVKLGLMNDLLTGKVRVTTPAPDSVEVAA